MHKVSGVMTYFKKLILTVSFGLFLSGCQTKVHYQGKQLKEEHINKIKSGKLSKRDVYELVGSPTGASDFGSDKWYYISKITETTAFLSPKIKNQNVITISFNKLGIVNSVDMKNLDHSNDVDLTERMTKTSGQKDSALKQLLGNFGRFAKKER